MPIGIIYAVLFTRRWLAQRTGPALPFNFATEKNYMPPPNSTMSSGYEYQGTHPANGSVNSAVTVVERLPFTVRLVRNMEDLQKAVLIRHSAYNRHVPELAETLRCPEPLDNEDGVVVLLAESKLNGAPVGTMRIQTNRFRPLTLEQSIHLPDWLQGKATAEATRLGVTDERVGRLVKTALFKAYFQYCEYVGIDWMVIAGRSPIDRQYERLMFEDVFPGAGFIPLRHAANMPHRVMAFSVTDARRKWRMASHPLFDYMVCTNHPDINVSLGPIQKRAQLRPARSLEAVAMTL